MVVFSLPLDFRRDLLCTETPELDTECETVWCKLNIIGCRTLYLGSFYRPPNRKPEIEKEYILAFNSSLNRIMSNKNAHALFGVTSIVGILSGALCRYSRGTEQASSESTFGNCARYKIQETLFNVDFQEYNLITLAMSYFVDKHDMKNCTSIHILTKITD